MDNQLFQEMLDQTIAEVIASSGLAIALDEAPIPAGMASAEILCADGDAKLIWDPTKQIEVDAAKATFDKLKSKGYWAYSVVGKDGSKGEVLYNFDPNVGKMILAPRLIGG